MATIKADTVIIVTLADHFGTKNNDCAMAIEKRALGRLLEAKIEIVVSLHFWRMSHVWRMI